MTQKTTTNKILILILITLLGVVGYLVKVGKISWPGLKTADNETRGWKTYKNSQLGFEVKYPPNWQVTEESSRLIEIHYNQNIDQLSSAIAYGGFNVSYRPLYDQTTPVSARSRSLDELVRQFGPPGGTTEDFTLDGLVAKKTTGHLGLQKIITVVAKTDDHYYWIDLEPTGPNEDLSVSVLEKILSTFKFVK